MAAAPRMYLREQKREAANGWMTSGRPTADKYLPRSHQRISLSSSNFEDNKIGLLEGFKTIQKGWKSPRYLQCQFYLHG